MRNLMIGLGLLGSLANANETALNIMPVADVLAHREISLGFGAGRTSHDRRWLSAYYVQAGWKDMIELGWDHDFDNHAVWNAKANLYNRGGRSLSAGIAHVSDRTEADQYVVGRQDFRGWRAHAGWRKWTGVHRGMIGIDADLGYGMTLMAEHIGGRDEFTWVGVNWEVPRVNGLALVASYGRANGGGDHHFVATATYNFKF